MKQNRFLIRLITLAVATIMCLVVVQTASATAPTGMVARWAFDEGIGSTVADATGNGNDGTLSGGKFGNALYFDGSDDYINIGNNPELKPTAQITIEALVKYDEFFSDSAGHGIVSEGHYYSNTGFMLYQNTGTPYNRVRFFICTTTGNYISSSNTLLSLDTWYHLALTYDGSTLSLYINGVLDKSISATGGIKWTPEYDLLIGSTYTPTGSKFSGTIDEVRISSTAHTSFDTANPPSVETDTVGLWHFDESVGTTAYDSSSYSNDGTIYGATWAGPTWTNGYFGKALSFDGIDDYVILDDNEFSDAELDEYTFEAWVYIESLDSVERRIFDDEGGLRPMLTSGNKLQAFHWDSTAWAGKTITWSTTPTTSTWYHITQTYDGSDLKFYIEGELVGTISCDAWKPDDLDREVNLGTWWQGLGRNWKGLIDETRIWNRALSDEEIKMHAWGLVGEWDFDEDSGSTAYDSSGFGNHGEIVSATRVSGRYGNALSFDGAEDYVSVPDNVVIEPSEITVEAWVKSSTSPGAYKHIISKDLTSHTGWSSYGLYTGSSGGLRFYIGHSNPTYTLSPDAGTGVWDGEWHHVAGTYDGAQVSLYVDGVFIGSSSSTESIDFEGTGSLFFGTYTPSRLFFQGEIDEVKIWNQALVPIKFDQTGLDCSAGGELVVEVSDPIPLNYEDLPFVMMVPSGSSVDYVFESIIPGGSGKQFVLQDVTGGASPSDAGVAPTSIIGNYETQYYLTVETNPAALTAFAEEGWYDQGTDVELTAPDICGYTFLYWKIDGAKQGDGVNPITVTMDSPHTATAYYFEWVTVSGHKYEDIDGSRPETDPLQDWTMKMYAFCDDFEDGNADGWTTFGTGGIWTIDDDDMGAGISKVYSQSDLTWTTTSTYDTYWRSYAGDPTWDDYTVEAKVKVVDDSGFAPIAGIFFRVQGFTDTSEYYLFRIDGRQPYGIALIKSPNTAVASYVPFDVNEGQVYNLKVEVSGANIKCYVDGALKIEKTDPDPLLGGAIGVGTFNSHSHFDDICVYQSTDTISDGSYDFIVKQPGTYAIEEELKDGWTQTYPADGYTIDITEGDAGITITDQDFWNFEWATISGTKYSTGKGFCDDFEIYECGSDGSPIWTADTGAWTIVEDGGHGQVYHGILVGRAFSNIDVETDSMIISADFKALDSSPPTSWANGFIIFDYIDPDNFKRAGLGVGDPRYIIDGFVSGVKVDSLQIAAPGISKETWYNLKVEIAGDTVYLYVDGTLEAQLTFTDPIGTGKIGVETGTAESYFDNFCFKPKTEMLENWDFILYDEYGAIHDEDTTGPDGQYELIAKYPGDYSVYEAVKDGWTLVYPDKEEAQYGPDEYLGYEVTIESSGEAVTGLDFWNFEWMTVSGYKFFDADGNGEYDTGEPDLQYWDIELYKDGALYGDDTTDETGYYEIQIKNPGIYTVKEILIADWWERTTDDYTFTVSSGEAVTYNFGNWLGPSEITTSGLCWFDKDEAEGRQFRVIFTPDVNDNPNLYKVSATNPGQFYYNIFFSGSLTTEIFEITLPEDFETQGANPIHVYNSLNTGPFGCLVPGEDITDQFEITLNGNLIGVDPIDPYNGFLYITVHCDYELKQTGGYEPHLYQDNYGIWRADAAREDVIEIFDLTDYTFSVSGLVSDSQTIENRNVFKKFRGIAGLVTKSDGITPSDDFTVTITGDVLTTPIVLTTDEDGFYGWNYFHKGKPTTFHVDFGGDIIDIKLKAGRFAEVSYQLLP